MSNRAQIGGVLSIVSGAIGALGALWVELVVFYLLLVGDKSGAAISDFVFVVGLGVLAAVVPVLATVGGILATQKKHWRWALAGSIASLFAFFPCGIPAVIFVSMGRMEFTSPTFPPPVAPTPPAPPPPSATPPG